MRTREKRRGKEMNPS